MALPDLTITDALNAQGFRDNAKSVKGYHDFMTARPHSVARESVAGRSVVVYKANDDPHKNDKWKRCKEAIENLAAGYDDFPTDIAVYLHTVEGIELPSLGYALFENDQYKLRIFIGSAAYNHRALHPPTKTYARGGYTATGGQRLVKDQVKDYYAPTWTKNSNHKMALCLVYHELGHAIHQWKSPSSYFSLKDQHEEIGSGRRGEDGKRRGDQELLGWANRKKTALGRIHDAYSVMAEKKVSSWAGAMGLPEIVAEMYSGLVMGVPFGDEAMELYAKLQGPMPPVASRHVRKGTGTDAGPRDWPADEIA